jgi:cystathionine gamma-lyase
MDSSSHVICIDDVYGGTQRLFRRIISNNSGIQFSFIDMSNVSIIQSIVTSSTKVIWAETPTNPTLKIVDIKAISDTLQSMGRSDIWLVIDNTFMSPYLQNPLTLGACIVVHSVTKYIGGHSDVVMGAVVTNDPTINEKLRFVQNGAGAVPSPFDCYMALRGLKTLHVRMNAAQSNAMAIASFLETHVLVDRVIYPGLKSHPNHTIATKQAKGYGAMITFYLHGGLQDAERFLSSLQLFTLAESLGAVESLAESPAIMVG